MTEKKSVLIQLKEFFGMSNSEFVKEWKELASEDQADLRKGVEDGTLNY